MTRSTLLLAGVVGCSAGPLEEASESGDSGDLVPNEDRASEALSANVEVTPREGLVDVAPLVNVIGVYDAELDPTSVPSAAVSFMDNLGRSVQVTTRLEGTDTVILEPIVPLRLGQTFTVQVSGLMLRGGSPAPNLETSFTVHPELNLARSQVFAAPTPLPSSDFLLFNRYEYDKADRLLVWTLASGSGPDAVWGTFDDELSSRTTIGYDAQGRQTSTVTYGDPGLDGVWDSGDDRVLRFSEITYEGSERLTLQYDAGGDGLASTDDDAITGGNLSLLDSQGQTLTSVSSTGPGPDGVWGNGDDPGAWGVQTTWDRFGNPIRRVDHEDAGEDSTFFTPDDILDGYTDQLHDEEGLWLTSLRVRGPGRDEQWFTTDDLVTNATRLVYDANGQVEFRLEAFTPGTDAKWATADDELRTYTEFIYNADGVLHQQRNISAGDDRTVGGDDDQINVYTRYMSNAEGFIVSDVTYTQSGDDGIWLNDDDQAFVSNTYTSPRPAAN